MKFLGYEIKKTAKETANPKPNTERESTIITPYRHQTYRLPKNPDDVVYKDGSLKSYYEMLADPQVKNAADFKKNLILGKGWKIINPKDSKGKELEEYSEIREFIYDCFTDYYAGSIDDDFFNILSALEFGYSVSEIVYRIDKDMTRLDSIKQVPADSIEFNIDEKGNYINEQLTQWSSKGKLTLDLKKFVILSWNKRDGNPYGVADLRSCRNAWFCKQQIQKFWNIYLERFGMPFPIIKYSKLTDTTTLSNMESILTAIQAGSAAIIPEDLMIEFIDVSRSGQAAYDQAIQRHNQEILVAFGIPDLMGFSGTKGGSYNLGDVQSSLMISQNLRAQKSFQEILNEQLIKRLVDYNFTGVKKYPRIEFESAIQDNDIEKARTYILALQTVTFKPSVDAINRLHEMLGMPVSEDVEIIDRQLGQDVDKNLKKDVPEDTKEEDVKPFAYQSDEKILFMDRNTDFIKVDKEFREKTDKAIRVINSLLTSSKFSLLEKIRATDLKKNPDFANRITIENMPNINTALERMLYSIALEGISDGNTEIERQIPKRFELEFSREVLVEDIESAIEKFALKDIPKLDSVSAKEFLKSFAKTKAFQLTDDLKNTIKKKTRQILLQGYDEGLTPKEIMSDIEEVFSPYIEGNILPDQAIAPYRLENIVRTNANNLYNLGRLASYEASARRGLLTHYQYSATLDNRTSTICMELHGTVIPANDGAMLNAIKPSRHFNCRSILIPITKYEQEELKQKVDEGILKTKLSHPNDWYDGFTYQKR